MRFLVLGAGGMAGHMISIFLKEQGHVVVGFARRNLPFVETQVGDAFDTQGLSRIINNGRFDVVVNAIGVLNKNADDDRPKAVYLNSLLPHLLAKITSGSSARIIHMSTDCVFAGNTGPYTENSLPDGMSFYDRTKALGELRDAKNLTLRNSIVGPDINENGIGLFNWFMKQKGSVKGFTKAIWTGMTTLELAKAIEHAAVYGDMGLVNMVPSESISKYDLLKLFNKYFKDGSIEVMACEELALDKTLVRTDFGSSFTPKEYDSQISEMALWVRQHSYLYPHYELER